MAKSTETKHKNSGQTSNSASAQDKRAADEPYRITDAQAFGRNMAKVAERSQRLLSEFVSRQTERFGREPLDPLNIGGAWFDLFKHMAVNPAAMLNAQWELWRDYSVCFSARRSARWDRRSSRWLHRRRVTGDSAIPNGRKA